MRISLSGPFYRHRPNRVLVSSQTLAQTVRRSYGPRLCLTLIRRLLAAYSHAPDEDGG